MGFRTTVCFQNDRLGELRPVEDAEQNTRTLQRLHDALCGASSQRCAPGGLVVVECAHADSHQTVRLFDYGGVVIPPARGWLPSGESRVGIGIDLNEMILRNMADACVADTSPDARFRVIKTTQGLGRKVQSLATGDVLAWAHRNADYTPNYGDLRIHGVVWREGDRIGLARFMPGRRGDYRTWTCSDRAVDGCVNAPKKLDRTNPLDDFRYSAGHSIILKRLE